MAKMALTLPEPEVRHTHTKARCEVLFPPALSHPPAMGSGQDTCHLLPQFPHLHFEGWDTSTGIEEGRDPEQTLQVASQGRGPKKSECFRPS